MAAIRRADQAAATHLRESLRIRGEVGAHLGVADCLEGLGVLGVDQHGPERIAVMLAAAAGIRKELEAPMAERYRKAVESASLAAGATLGKEKLEAAQRKGREMDLEEAAGFGMEPRG